MRRGFIALSAEMSFPGLTGTTGSVLSAYRLSSLVSPSLERLLLVCLRMSDVLGFLGICIAS